MLKYTEKLYFHARVGKLSLDPATKGCLKLSRIFEVFICLEGYWEVLGAVKRFSGVYMFKGIGVSGKSEQH